MKNRQFVQRIVGLSMAVVMTIMSVDTSGLQAYMGTVETCGEEQVPKIQQSIQKIKPLSQAVAKGRKDAKKTGYIDIGHVAQSVQGNNKNPLKLDNAVTLPESYSSVEKGYVTSIKNQNPWGTCWAFAACAAMESYALSHGLVESAEDVDFSEYALAYLTFSDDMYMNITGDYTETTDEYVGFDEGGNDEYAFKTLSKWAGIYNEDDVMYPNSQQNDEVAPYIPDEDNMDFVLTGQYYINSIDVEAIKAAIMENGALTCSYYSSEKYTRENELYIYNYELDTTNHAVTLVGWDDNKDKNLFTMTDENGVAHTPENNGAWLIKNSWSTYFGDDGYCWISYEDYGFNCGDAVVYEIAPKSNYDYIYQYDGATVFAGSAAAMKFANIFEIDGNEEQTLDAISFAVMSTDLRYTVSIYKNNGEKILEDGELLTSKEGIVTFEGYYTVELDDEIVLSPGDSVSVVISFDEMAYMVYEYDGITLGMNGYAQTYCSSKEGRTYYCYWEDYGFEDFSYRGDLCIKAFTSIAQEVEGTRITSIDNSKSTELVIKWKEVEGAEAYILSKSISGTFEDEEIIQNITTNSYTDTNVSIGNTYYYRVCAVVSGVATSYSAVKSATVEISAPKLIGENKGDYVSLTWEEKEDADGYRLYKSVDDEEYELIQEFGQSTLNFDDYDLDFGHTYSYVLTAFITIDGQEFESSKSLAYTTEKEVPMVEGLYVDSAFYNKIIVRWDESEQKVDGYNIYMCAEDESYFTLIDSVDSDVTHYTYDVSGVAAGTYYYFGVAPYIIVDGVELENEEFIWDYNCVLEQPLQIEYVKWYVEDDQLVMKYKGEESDTGYTIWYNGEGETFYDSYQDIEFWSVYDEYIETTLELDPYIQRSIYITDYYYSKMFQEYPINIGGEYKEPQSEYIDDVILPEGITTAILTATITNEMENFEYLYQWYVSDTAEGTATAIEGATSNEYTATVAADEEKYYYCSIISRHENETTVNTTNSEGKRTKVAGSKSQVIDVENIANQTYTGSAITPNVTVTKGAKILTKGVDYTLSYANNVNAGTATVTVNFIGDNVGMTPVSKTFTINPRGVSDVIVNYTSEYAYTGSPIKPVPTVKNSIETLVNGTDYTLAYTNNVNIGTATITITFKGNYTGTKTITFTIKNPVPTSITSATYSVNQTGGNISKITVGTTAATFLNGLKEKQYVVIRNGNTTVSTTTVLATGMKACIMNGNTVVKSYDIIVTGDTNGDGKINITDMIAVKANILKKSTLSGLYAKAADVNGDGKINITDFIKIKATLLKKDSIVGVTAK